MLKVGQVLYKRYGGLIRKEGGNDFMSCDRVAGDRSFVDHVTKETVVIDGFGFTVNPDGDGLSWKTFFSEV